MSYQSMKPPPVNGGSQQSSVEEALAGPRPNLTALSKRKTAAPKVDIISMMDNPILFGQWFQPKELWFSWRVALAAAFGLPIERTGNPKEAMKLFTACTARTKWPTEQADTVALVCGVRSGKSKMSALIACYLATLREYSQYLSPGEKGFIPLIAADRKQARVVFNYASAYSTGSELLSELLAEEPLKERISFANNIDIEIMTASFRATRGYTTVGGVFDEIAYYRSDDSATPDAEIVQSVRRGTLTIPNSMLMMISSPYAKRGVFYDTYKANWGINDSPTFVWQAPTWVMNRTVTRESLQPEFDRDNEKANADYGGEFRNDVERFVPMSVIERCVQQDVREIGPSPSTYYFAFVDPSGGTSDSMTLAIGHNSQDLDDVTKETANYVIIDALYERIPQPQFSPDEVVKEFAAYLKKYGITSVTGDRYAGLWPAERFAAYGITYEQCKKPASDLYRDTLPLLNSNRLKLLDNPRLIKQLWDLERRTGASGKDTITHPKGGHDDCANAVAGVASHLAEQGEVSLTW